MTCGRLFSLPKTSREFTILLFFRYFEESKNRWFEGHLQGILTEDQVDLMAWSEMYLTFRLDHIQMGFRFLRELEVRMNLASKRIQLLFLDNH